MTIPFSHSGHHKIKSLRGCDYAWLSVFSRLDDDFPLSILDCIRADDPNPGDEIKFLVAEFFKRGQGPGNVDYPTVEMVNVPPAIHATPT